MAKAIFNGVTVAESDQCETVEGNLYFPPDSLNRSYFQESTYTTVCGWKGTAQYYDVVAEGETAKNGAWYYPSAKDAAKNIEGYFAFWNGVVVEP